MSTCSHLDSKATLCFAIYFQLVRAPHLSDFSPIWKLVTFTTTWPLLELPGFYNDLTTDTHKVTSNYDVSLFLKGWKPVMNWHRCIKQHYSYKQHKIFELRDRYQTAITLQLSHKGRNSISLHILYSSIWWENTVQILIYLLNTHLQQEYKNDQLKNKYWKHY